MCKFASWVDWEGKIFFLSDKELSTAKGRELQEYCSPEDLIGHGAIRRYFELSSKQGESRECSDFSRLSNFPEPIIEMIRAGNFTGLNTAVPELLSPLSRRKWEEVRQPAYEKYEKTRQLARVEYDKVEQPAWEEYERTDQPARIKYERTIQFACAKYNKAEQLARIEYKQVEQSAFWDLYKDPKNRLEIWQ